MEKRRRIINGTFTNRNYGGIHEIIVNILENEVSDKELQKVLQFFDTFNRNFKPIKDLNLPADSKVLRLAITGLAVTTFNNFHRRVHLQRIKTFIYNFIQAEIDDYIKHKDKRYFATYKEFIK